MQTTFAKRVIPCLDVKDGRVVKGTNFVGLRDAGDPVELAKRYDEEGADEIVFLDITASHEKRKTMDHVVSSCASEVFIPLTAGVKNPELIREGALRFGRQCIVAAIDARRTGRDTWEVYINGGRTPTGLDCVAWAKDAVRLGAGEILLTSMDADGTKNGYDIELTRAVSESVNVPVIASGGAGTLQHFYDVLTKGKADAVLAASLFHYGEFTIEEVKTYLRSHGLGVRL